MRICKKCKTEFGDKEQKCPNCGKIYTPKAILGCAIVFIIAFVLMLIIALNTSSPSDTDINNEMKATTYAKTYLRGQMREPNKTEITFETIYEKKDNNSWVMSGIVSGPNMLGGRSLQKFAIQVQYNIGGIEGDYRVMSCYLGEPY